MNLIESYFNLRGRIRKNAFLNRSIYLAQSLYYGHFGALAAEQRAWRRQNRGFVGTGVALCLRFRDEALYLREWIEYYRAAGIEHFFLYNNFSEDHYERVLAPYAAQGLVTLIDWPRVPASPAAEEDCIRRTRGIYRWVGFIDADEFCVIQNGDSIPAFLENYIEYPAVGVHWIIYGSCGHKKRPTGPVIAAYNRRQNKINIHVKCFVQPQFVTHNRNSHAWFYLDHRAAVDEDTNKIYGAVAIPAVASKSRINHYYCKSEQDFIEKGSRKTTLDKVGIMFPTRTPEKLAKEMAKANDIVDLSALEYYRKRCQSLGIPDVLTATANR